MNLFFLAIFGLVVLALVIFLVAKNQKDEKKFEDQVNADYRDPEDIVNNETDD